VEGSEEIMSDFVLGTIIGGAIGVFGSLLGFILQGYFSVKTTKIQIDARMEEQQKQFEYQEKQAQITRLVEDRARYLNPLRDQITKCYSLAVKSSNNIIEIIVRYGNPPDPARLSFLETTDNYGIMVRNLSATVGELRGSLEQADILRSKSGDHTLAELIDKASNTCIELSIDAGTLQRRLEKWLKAPDAEMPVNLEEMQNKVASLSDTLEDVNRRIELLLSGIDKTSEA
jgi:hypothetical protein